MNIQSSHGWSNTEQQLIGSHAEKIIRRAKNPVLTFKAGRIPDTFKTVLLATDFSDTANDALESALLFTNIYKAKLHLLHVVNRQIWYDAFLLTGFEFNVLEEQVYKQAESCLRDLLRDFIEDDISCEIHITRGMPLEQMEYLASKLRADLIVLGTHGNTNAENVLIGSVAEKIVRHSPCAVLTVPRHS
jgi:nucleotide-binding universal stress UspA family protein